MSLNQVKTIPCHSLVLTVEFSPNEEIKSIPELFKSKCHILYVIPKAFIKMNEFSPKNFPNQYCIE